MAYLLLCGRLPDARGARPRRFRLFNAHLDEYLSKNDVKIPFWYTHVQYCRIDSIRQNNILFVVDRKIAFH